MQQELHRLSTYINWPQEAEANSLTLAREGFYYTGEGDKVTCSACLISLDNWKSNETPLEKHRRLSPQCKFTLETTASNELHLRNTSLPNKGATTTDNSNNANINSHLADKGVGKLQEVLASVLNRAGKNGVLTNNNNVQSVLTNSNSNGNRQSTSIVDYDKLHSEAARFSTFSNWPQDAFADPTALAREGLFYTGKEDKVQCVFCKGLISKWEPTDVPSIEHRKHFPGCRFVQGLNVGNIPILSGTTIDSVPDNARNYQTESSMQLRAESSPVGRSEQLAKNVEALVQPKFPSFSSMNSRIESFEKGVIPQGQTVKHLAEAGWFFVGPGDKVRCFQCGGNLRDWEQGDDPWEEHRRWYKDCAHLKTQRTTIEPKHQPAATSDAVKFRIEPREIKARMDTPTVRAILNLGYESSLVRQVIEKQLINTGDDFTSAEALLEAIFALDDPTSSLPNEASASNNFDVFTDEIATETKTHLTTKSGNRISPTSSSPPTSSSSVSMATNLTSAPLSLTQKIPTHTINSASGLLSIFPQIHSEISSSSASNQSQTISDEKSKSKAKRKKNKKKNPVAAAAMTQEQEQRTGCEKGADTKGPTSEGIDDETLEYFEENRRLRDARSCKVCMDAEVNTVFLPCGHLVCCDKCAPLLKDCPICRTFIRGTVKTFLS